ncbi:hypothetical protein NDU88_004797 [Pleurodeles waltl]|uniref:Uncharacterized protein n=1 Tax=Pleurodeles waltl TaxID=8319 RepID=A0AAV7V622_PLEWA|nr:hypothetical protein NDU88_004797 [Pleurodeles waltl]
MPVPTVKHQVDAEATSLARGRQESFVSHRRQRFLHTEALDVRCKEAGWGQRGAQRCKRASMQRYVVASSQAALLSLRPETASGRTSLLGYPSSKPGPVRRSLGGPWDPVAGQLLCGAAPPAPPVSVKLN